MINVIHINLTSNWFLFNRTIIWFWIWWAILIYLIENRCISCNWSIFHWRVITLHAFTRQRKFLNKTVCRIFAWFSSLAIILPEIKILKFKLIGLRIFWGNYVHFTIDFSLCYRILFNLENWLLSWLLFWRRFLNYNLFLASWLRNFLFQDL